MKDSPQDPRLGLDARERQILGVLGFANKILPRSARPVATGCCLNAWRLFGEQVSPVPLAALNEQYLYAELDSVVGNERLALLPEAQMLIRS